MNPLMGGGGTGLQMGAQQLKFQGFWHNYRSVTFLVFNTATDTLQFQLSCHTAYKTQLVMSDMRERTLPSYIPLLLRR